MAAPRPKVIGFRVTAETAQRVRKAAAEDDRCVSAFVRRLIERSLAEPPATPYADTRRAAG